MKNQPNILEKIPDFNKRQIGIRLTTLTPKKFFKDFQYFLHK